MYRHNYRFHISMDLVQHQPSIRFIVVSLLRGDSDSGCFGKPLATTTTGLYVGLCSIRWFESGTARFATATFPSGAIKLDQSDGR